MGRDIVSLVASSFKRFPGKALIGLAFCLCSVSSWGFGFSAASTCNPMAEETCGLPFPSDVFRTTLGRYGFSDRILDRRASGPVRVLLPARAQFPNSFQPSEIFNNSTGFSALGPILFELNEFPFHEIPRDGEGHLHVYKRSTGERVPMIVSLSKAAQPKRDLRDDNPVIIAWPETRLEFGEKYIAVLFKEPFNDVPEANGQEIFQPTEGVTEALALDAGWVLNYVYEPVVADLQALGIDNDDILSFTWFTVRRKSEVVEPMQKMVAAALDGINYVRDLEVADVPVGDPDDGLVTLHGLMSITNFRSPDGGVHSPYEPIEDNSRRRTEFTLTLPKVDQGTSVPVSIWGHGLGSEKEFTDTGYVMSDRLGMATFAIDHPNHGTRVTPYDINKEPHVSMAISSPLSMMQLLGMFVQGTVDQNVAIFNAKYRLPNVLANWSHPDYPNVPAIDGRRMIFDGLSLGAILGVGIGAVAPELSGAYITNGAGSFIQVLSESTFWDSLASNVVPQNMSGAELTFVLAMMQHYLDIADGNNFAELYRNPINGNSPRALGMHYSLGDGSVTNDASIATAQLVDLPLLKEVREPEPLLRYGDVGLDGFEDGYGLVQSDFGLELADQTLDSLDELDIEDRLNLGDSNSLTSLLGIDPNSLTSGNGFTDYLQRLFGIQEGQQLSDTVETIYTGDLEDFLTHFNRRSEASVHRSIEWRCSVLALADSVCQSAKQKASKDIEEQANQDSGGNQIDNSLDNLGDVVNEGLSNIQVTEGSSGSFSLWMLLMLALVWAMRRKLQS